MPCGAEASMHVLAEHLDRADKPMTGGRVDNSECNSRQVIWRMGEA